MVKRRLIIFFSFVFILTLAIIYTNSKTPLYQASASVRVATSPRAFQEGFMMTVQDNLSNYANLITSKEVMDRVVIRLKLLPPNAKARDLINKTAEIRGAISAVADEGSDTISIDVIYPNPELAAAIANQTATAFTEVDLNEKSKQARNLRRFIERQLNDFSTKLKRTEDRLKEFRQSGRALGVAVGMEERLADLEKERSILMKQFTEKHPDILKINAQIDSLRDRIKKLPGDELELARLQRELEINDRSYRSMKDKYEMARLAEAEKVSDVVVLESAGVPTTPVSPKKNMNKLAGALVGLIVGIIFAFVQENLDTSIGAIEDVEQIVRLPVIGVIPYFNPNAQEIPWWRMDRLLLDYFMRRKDTIPDSSYLIMNQDSFSTLSEAYRILRTFVEFLMSEKKEAKILMITSTGPQEGKTLTACNLAISLAQGGKKTLLIDADLRRPMVHRLFGLQRAPGLSDVLLGTVGLNDARRTMGDILVGEQSQWDQMLATKMLDRLDVLTTGIHTHTPAELIASDSMKSFFRQTSVFYDYIIVDAPPVLPVTDSRTLGLYADCAFFIYRAGKTARRALTRAREELNLAGVKVKGVILNQATPEVTLTDSYYYQYYGEKPPKRGQKKETVKE
jgi:tyrosine-protein kinase Etk/Wzc